MNFAEQPLASLTSAIRMGPFGSSIKKERFESTGVPVINGRHLHGVRLADAAGYEYISEAHADELRNANARAGDVVVTHRGTLGQASLIPENAEFSRYVISQSQLLVRSNLEVLYPEFLAYFLNSPMGQLRILDFATQTGVPAIAQPSRSIAKIRVPLPQLAEQQAIAEVLGALDDKIAANTALAASADQLMHQTFLCAHSTDRVPLSSRAQFINGRAFTKGASGSGRVVVRIAELNNGISGSTVYSDSVVPDQHVVRAGDILFAWSGSLTLHRWFRDDAIVNQHIFKVLPGANTPPWLAYELIRQKLDDFKGTAADRATTMGHIQRHHLDELVSAPTPELVAELDPLMDGLWRTALEAERENLTLAATRDALLPQLMSGKLRVRDAEEVASAAGA